MEGERKKEWMILHMPKMKDKTILLRKFEYNLIIMVTSEREKAFSEGLKRDCKESTEIKFRKIKCPCTGCNE